MNFKKMIAILTALFFITSCTSSDNPQQPFTPNPTQIQETVQAVVDTRFEQTRGAQLFIDATRTIIADNQLNLTATANFDATVNAVFNQSLVATEQAMRAIIPTPINNFSPLSQDNIDDITLAYSLPLQCLAISPDSRLIALPQNGVYEIATGNRLFNIEGESRTFHTFSPDGSLLAINGGGATTQRLYNVYTGDLKFQISGAFSPNSQYIAVDYEGIYNVTAGDLEFSLNVDWATFSPNGRFVVALGDGVYEVGTWRKLFPIESGSILWSHDSRLLAVSNEAVYNTSTGEIVFDISSFEYHMNLAFSPDDRLLAISGNAVYDATTWEQRFLISENSNYVTFSHDGKYLVASMDGIIDLTTGERLFYTPVGDYAFSPNSDLLAIAGDGLYQVSSGEKLFYIPSGDVTFSPDGTIFIVSFRQEFDVKESRSSGSSIDVCLIYGSNQNDWGYRAGLVTTSEPIFVYDSPSGAVVSNIVNDIAVFATTPDKLWYAVFVPIYLESSIIPYTWISASDVTVVHMPDNMPTEIPDVFPMEKLTQ